MSSVTRKDLLGVTTSQRYPTTFLPTNARPRFISAGFGTAHVFQITNVKTRAAIVVSGTRFDLWLSTLMIAASSSWT